MTMFCFFQMIDGKAGMQVWHKTASQMHVVLRTLYIVDKMPQMLPQTCPTRPAVPGSTLVCHDLPFHRLPLTGLNAFEYTGLNAQQLHISGRMEISVSTYSKSTLWSQLENLTTLTKENQFFTLFLKFSSTCGTNKAVVRAWLNRRKESNSVGLVLRIYFKAKSWYVADM